MTVQVQTIKTGQFRDQSRSRLNCPNPNPYELTIMRSREVSYTQCRLTGELTMVQLNTNPPASHADPQETVHSLPTNLESNEPPLESDLHREQIDRLIRLLKYGWQDP